MFSVAEDFPLGRKFGEDVPMPVASGRFPFGIRLAVASKPVEVNLSHLFYDPDRQIAVVGDGGDPVPLLEQTSYSTKTSTAPRDASPSDADSDAEED